VSHQLQSDCAKEGGGFLYRETVMLIQAHSVKNAREPQHLQYRVNKPGGHREDEQAAGVQEAFTGPSQAALLFHRQMFHNGKQRDDIVRSGVGHVRGKPTRKQSDRLSLLGVSQGRINAHPIPDLSPELPEEGPIGTTDIEDARPGWDVRFRLGDAPALEGSI
jgi:hypothetical protein